MNELSEKNWLSAILLEIISKSEQSEFQSSFYSAIQGATGLKLYYVIAYQKVDGQHIRKDFCNSNTFKDI